MPRRAAPVRGTEHKDEQVSLSLDRSIPKRLVYSSIEVPRSTARPSQGWSRHSEWA
jgi:hypothetical protein